MPRNRTRRAPGHPRARVRTAGLPPGTPVYTGPPVAAKPKVTAFDYNEREVRETESGELEALVPFHDSPDVTWINVAGLGDVDLIKRIGTLFGLHPLIQEDIPNTNERAKMEDYGSLVFVVLKIFHAADGPAEGHLHQVSLVLGKNFVLSFEEKENPAFDAVRERIRKGKGRIRREGADYLAYSLLDTVVDSYFGTIDDLNERVDALEDSLVSDPGRETLQAIHELKRRLVEMRRAVWPLREVVNGLERLESPLLSPSTRPFLRDAYDHTIQLIENVDGAREVLSGMLDIYLSSVSNRMNEVMKVLTIIATIFIPLTFIVGVYGMNFENMPEIRSRYGYYVVWGVILAVAALMLAYFRKKKWF